MKTLPFLTYVPTREALLSSSGQPFDWVESGQLRVNIGQRYPLLSMHGRTGSCRRERRLSFGRIPSKL